jgi:hypothetical protein
MRVPRRADSRTLQEEPTQLANFVHPAGRGLPLLMPSPAVERTIPCAPAGAAVHRDSWSSVDILPLSMVAVLGPRAGTAAMLPFVERG